MAASTDKTETTAKTTKDKPSPSKAARKTATNGKSQASKAKPEPKPEPSKAVVLAEAAHDALDHRIDKLVDATPLYAAVLREQAPGWIRTDSDDVREHRSEALVDRLILAGGNR